MKNSIIIALSSAVAFAGTVPAAEAHQSAESSQYDTELESLVGDPRVVAASEHIASDHDSRLDDLVALNEIPAPPFAEEARAAAFADMMRATGFGEVTIDEVGNVVARREGTSERSVMMVAHIDTVFPADTDVGVTVDGNRYTAPGIGDNTRGAIMLLEIASAIAEADIRTDADIALVGNVGEEGLGDLRGVRHLFREGAERPDSFIAIDGGDESRIINSAVGSNRYKVTFNGQGGHSWSDFGAANPHHAAARAITHFADAALPVTQEGERSSFSVGRIGGGTSVNSIPFESWFEVDMRSGDPERLAALDEVFQEAMQQGLSDENETLTRNEPLTVAIEPIGRRPAGRGDANAPLLLRAQAAMRSDGLEPQLSASSTDSNIPISLGIPAITISRCGESGRAHSLDEYWIDNENVVPCTVRGMRILLLEAELAG